jgi:hypothetical protein
MTIPKAAVEAARAELEQLAGQLEGAHKIGFNDGIEAAAQVVKDHIYTTSTREELIAAIRALVKP